jgi:alkylhydroperoxidase family enzyme
VDGTPDDLPLTGAGAGKPRLPPLPPGQWPAKMRDALAALRPAEPRHPFPEQGGGRPRGLNALGMLAHHPELTRAFNTFNGHLLFGTTLSPRQRELLVLRVAAVRQAAYEWAQHVVLAGDAGLDADDVARIAQGPDAPGWSPVERAMVRAVDELLADALITEGTWAVLAGELDDQQLMDLVFTVGAYELLAMAFRTFGVELDDDLLRK